MRKRCILAMRCCGCCCPNPDFLNLVLAFIVVIQPAMSLDVSLTLNLDSDSNSADIEDTYINVGLTKNQLNHDRSNDTASIDPHTQTKNNNRISTVENIENKAAAAAAEKSQQRKMILGCSCKFRWIYVLLHKYRKEKRKTISLMCRRAQMLPQKSFAIGFMTIYTQAKCFYCKENNNRIASERRLEAKGEKNSVIFDSS